MHLRGCSQPGWRLALKKIALAAGIGNESRIRRSPFYARYPFASKVNIFSADGRGLVDHELRIFYNRIPKSASTSVVLTLCNVRFGLEHKLGALKAKKSFPRPSQLDKAQLSALEGYFKCTFVRNPYGRVLSAYLNKVVYGHIVPFSLAGQSEVPFGEFCRYLEDGGLYDDPHWAPQTSLLLLPLFKFDFIGQVETFQDDIQHVLIRIGIEDPTRVVVRHSNRPTEANARLHEYYDQDTRELIAKLYRDDFEAFGYDYDMS